MAGRDVKLAVMPTRALRLACGTEISFRVAVKHGDQLPVGSEVGHPSAADRDEPEVAFLIEGAALKKLALRLIVDIREQSRPARYPAAGAEPHGCTCSGDGGPASGGAGTGWACADAV